MKLISLEITGEGSGAWSSGKLRFGRRVTQLFGENGCGKTPIVQSIVFALGYNVDYPNKIVDHCDHVALEIGLGSQKILLRRSIKSKFSVTASKQDGTILDFASEREYSNFLFTLCGLEDRTVTTVGNEASAIYFQQVLPLFYLDQDHGYSVAYYSPSKYLRDQYAEVTRLVFNLAPKRLFDRRREKFELQDRLEYLDRAIVRRESNIGELSKDLGSQRRPVAEIEFELKDAVERLELLRKGNDVARQVDAELEAQISSLREKERGLLRERSDLSARVRGLKNIHHEIEVEANTLSLNEEARRVFASFDAICSNESCGLFVRSSQSYGKSLLYLKDQAKDLDRVCAGHERRIAGISLELDSLKEEVSALIGKQGAQEASSPVAALVDVVEHLTQTVIRLKQSKRIEEELMREEKDYLLKLEDRAQVQKRLGGLDGDSAGTDLEILKVRNALAARVSYWLEVLESVNVDRSDVQVSREFVFTFGGEKLEKFKGSTLVRVVLAIRTACFELLTLDKERAPRFLVLDTPRQQDIKRESLARYIKALQELSVRNDVQIVFSTTNHRYALGADDGEWVAKFPGETQAMFLGSEGSARTEDESKG